VDRTAAPPLPVVAAATASVAKAAPRCDGWHWDESQPWSHYPVLRRRQRLLLPAHSPAPPTLCPRQALTFSDSDCYSDDPDSLPAAAAAAAVAEATGVAFADGAADGAATAGASAGGVGGSAATVVGGGCDGTAAEPRATTVSAGAPRPAAVVARALRPALRQRTMAIGDCDGDEEADRLALSEFGTAWASSSLSQASSSGLLSKITRTVLVRVLV
jgi:hypothetical protein